MTKLNSNQTVIQGDCLEVIPTLEADSIQLVCTSPHFFNSGKKYQRGKGIHNTVPVGEPLYDILDMMELLRPKVKENGFVAINMAFSYSEGQINRIGEMIRQIERKTHWFCVDKIYWLKRNPIPLRGRMSNAVEEIPIFSKHPHSKYPKNPNYELNYIYTSVTQGKNGIQKPFPEELPYKCIDVLSNEGDIVLDPFSGSGTTGKVALELNRKYIGIDLNETNTNYQTETLVTERRNGNE